MLRAEGLVRNHKRTERIYRWSMDFVHDQLSDGRRFRCLTIVDELTRQSLAIVVDHSIGGVGVVRMLDELLGERSKPRLLAGETDVHLTDGQTHLDAYYDHAQGELVLDTSAMSKELSYRSGNVYRGPLRVKPGEPVTLRFFSDRSVFELYANDESVISGAFIFHHPGSLKAAAMHRKGPKIPFTVDGWDMQPLNGLEQSNVELHCESHSSHRPAARSAAGPPCRRLHHLRCRHRTCADHRFQRCATAHSRCGGDAGRIH